MASRVVVIMPVVVVVVAVVAAVVVHRRLCACRANKGADTANRCK